MSKPIYIEFSPESVMKRVQDMSLSTWVLAVLVLVVLTGVTWHGSKLLQKKARIDDSVSNLQIDIQKAEKKVGKEPVFKLPQEQAVAVNQAIAKLNIPWTDLLDALEQASTDKVAILQITPNAQKMNVKLMAEAKNSDDMIAYVETLKQQKMFVSVILEKHEINEQDPNKPYRFQIEMLWRDGVRQ
ncbi:PilN domain-containing protein [Undibacterium sp. TS12]|uniref:PilN domain-containing protein n=1 Tax=Undibacterium sp. TS12 TaxID=2908202 RepID=UPI001F4D0746|nr:PilN domain-containing protein [Undibacterium sp. TS12]MCH8621744.1 PilN domain-containing protein [Undibacterium sp. TS12]